MVCVVVAANAGRQRTVICEQPSRLLDLRGGFASATAQGRWARRPDVPRPRHDSVCSDLTPSAALLQWRATRLSRFANSFDASRYHAQVLFVDDDGSRARVCEAILERVAMWADAGWWIYPHSASTSTNVDDGQEPPPSLLRSSERLRLCPARISARASTLDPSDLVHYDIVLCADLSTLEQVRALASSHADGGGFGQGEWNDDAVLCVADFLSSFSSASAAASPDADGVVPGSGPGDGVGWGTADRMEALDDEMRDFIAPHYREVSALLELPSVYPSQPEEWERLLAACALACAGLTDFLKARVPARTASSGGMLP